MTARFRGLEQVRTKHRHGCTIGVHLFNDSDTRTNQTEARSLCCFASCGSKYEYVIVVNAGTSARNK